jgi:hypothetical protein
MNGGSVTPSNPLPDGKYKFNAGGGLNFALMTAASGVIQVYAASEDEGNNINRYNSSGVCEGQDLNAGILNAIATIAATYDNFVRVERYTMSAAAVDMSKYELLV